DDGAALSTTYTDQLSSAELHPDVDGAGVLVGYPLVDDPVNTDDTAGSAAFEGVGALFSFARRNRTSAPGAVFPGGDLGPCASGQTCSIFDGNLRAGDIGDPNGGGAGASGPVASLRRPLPVGSRAMIWAGFAAVAGDDEACQLLAQGSRAFGKGQCSS